MFATQNDNQENFLNIYLLEVHKVNYTQNDYQEKFLNIYLLEVQEVNYQKADHLLHFFVGHMDVCCRCYDLLVIS